jgi:hypothetical protein
MSTKSYTRMEYNWKPRDLPWAFESNIPKRLSTKFNVIMARNGEPPWSPEKCTPTRKINIILTTNSNNNNNMKDCYQYHPIDWPPTMPRTGVDTFEVFTPFACEDALLHGVETRTSSPVRVSRNAETLEAEGTMNLYPAGEGAGFAGGIVSAAVDGISVANAILQKIAANR